MKAIMILPENAGHKTVKSAFRHLMVSFDP